jgi:chromosome partitioning protein
MPFIITVAQRKGGAGKTTIAAHLAAGLALRGCVTAAIDLDDQCSLTSWVRRRANAKDAPQIILDENVKFSLAFRLSRLRKAADAIVIDTPPAADRTVQQAMREADLILAPMQLTPLDLEASLPTARMIGASLRPGVFVINRAPPRARIADLIRSKIVESRLPVAKAELGSRAAFAESMVAGKSALETDPSGPAATEFAALVDQVADCAGDRLRRSAA